MEYKNINFKVGIPNLDDYYMMLAFVVSIRANCLNRSVGAVLTTPDNKHILATGYNGVPSGLPHCTECVRRVKGFGPGEGLNFSRAAHAEQNIFAQLARNNSGSSRDCTLYVTDSPCNECSKLIINGGIKRVVYANEYPNKEVIAILRDAGIEVIRLDRNRIISKLHEFTGLLS